MENLRIFKPVAFVVESLFWILKDAYRGQSIGKYKYKIKVVGEDGNPATLKQLIIKNIPMIVWPIEAYRIFHTSKPRLGDVWAKTMVILIDE